MDLEENPAGYWHILPDPVLLYVFSHLNAKQLVNVRKTCRNWLRIATDELLWKRLFQNDFKIDRSIPIAPGRYSWFNEYRRLKYHTPTQETEVLTEHTHQVLHVSFSHNGEMFASSSKDGYIKVRKIQCRLILLMLMLTAQKEVQTSFRTIGYARKFMLERRFPIKDNNK